MELKIIKCSLLVSWHMWLESRNACFKAALIVAFCGCTDTCAWNILATLWDWRIHTNSKKFIVFEYSEPQLLLLTVEICTSPKKQQSIQILQDKYIPSTGYLNGNTSTQSYVDLPGECCSWSEPSPSHACLNVTNPSPVNKVWVITVVDECDLMEFPQASSQMFFWNGKLNNIHLALTTSYYRD